MYKIQNPKSPANNKIKSNVPSFVARRKKYSRGDYDAEKPRAIAKLANNRRRCSIPSKQRSGEARSSVQPCDEKRSVGRYPSVAN